MVISEFFDCWIAVEGEWRLTLLKISNTDTNLQLVVERDFSVDMTASTDEYEQDWIELGEHPTNLSRNTRNREIVNQFFTKCFAAINRGKNKAKEQANG